MHTIGGEGWASTRLERRIREMRNDRKQVPQEAVDAFRKGFRVVKNTNSEILERVWDWDELERRMAQRDDRTFIRIQRRRKLRKEKRRQRKDV